MDLEMRIALDTALVFFSQHLERRALEFFGVYRVAFDGQVKRFAELFLMYNL